MRVGIFFLQQWNAQINILSIPDIAQNKIRGEMVDEPGKGVDIIHTKPPQAVSVVQTQNITGSDL